MNLASARKPKVRARSFRCGSSIVAIAALATTHPPCGDGVDQPATDPAPVSLELSGVLNDSDRVVAGLDTSEVSGYLTWVWYGRILPDQRGVILADQTAPFLRVFDRTGRLITTALPRGDGPNEARTVSGLAVSDAGDVLALTGLRRTALKEFSLEGDTMRFVRTAPSPSDIPMFTLASRCGHGWAAYTTRHLRSPARIPVLAVSESDPSGGLVWRNAFSWVTQTVNFGWGSPQRMVSDNRNVYLWHSYSRDAPILVFPCESEDDSARVLRHTEEVLIDQRLQGAVDRGGEALAIEALTIEYPDTSYAGLAVLGGILFESETVTGALDDGVREHFTIFSVTESGKRASVRVPGEWDILDGRGVELLVTGEHEATMSPVALLLPIEAVQRAVSRRLRSTGG